MFFQNPTKEEIVGLIIKVFPTIGEPVTEMQLLQLFQGIQKLRFLKEQRGGYLNDSDLAREARRIFGSSAPQVKLGGVAGDLQLFNLHIRIRQLAMLWCSS